MSNVRVLNLPITPPGQGVASLVGVVTEALLSRPAHPGPAHPGAWQHTLRLGEAGGGVGEKGGWAEG